MPRSRLRADAHRRPRVGVVGELLGERGQVGAVDPARPPAVSWSSASRPCVDPAAHGVVADAEQRGRLTDPQIRHGMDRTTADAALSSPYGPQTRSGEVGGEVRGDLLEQRHGALHQLGRHPGAGPETDRASRTGASSTGTATHRTPISCSPSSSA